ncbi:MAG: hypothetical protein HY023_11380 [Chloroflexi bacterium]|nr:hypothetical protein [Chloroflexota bacterium]
MTTKVIQITTDELTEIIGAVVEQKLIELFGDPDEGLVLTRTMRNRLLRQKKAVASGERGELFESVVVRLRLA